MHLASDLEKFYPQYLAKIKQGQLTFSGSSFYGRKSATRGDLRPKTALRFSGLRKAQPRHKFKA